MLLLLFFLFFDQSAVARAELAEGQPFISISISFIPPFTVPFNNLQLYAYVLSLNLPLTEARLFREASEERRSGKRRDCHCECCCTKAKANDGQDDTTAKHRPQLSASRNCTGGWHYSCKKKEEGQTREGDGTEREGSERWTEKTGQSDDPDLIDDVVLRTRKVNAPQ